MNTNTPRTDEQEFNESGGFDVDWPDFARTLETELAKVTKERDEWKQSDNEVRGILRRETQRLEAEVESKCQMIRKLTVERDAAMAELEKLQNQLSPHTSTQTNNP